MDGLTRATTEGRERAQHRVLAVTAAAGLAAAGITGALTLTLGLGLGLGADAATAAATGTTSTTSTTSPTTDTTSTATSGSVTSSGQAAVASSGGS